jgi:hypothetical protein
MNPLSYLPALVAALAAVALWLAVILLSANSW